MTTSKLLHCLESQQFGRQLLEHIFTVADGMKGDHGQPLKGKILATIFYEPSTRTRLSFESAMMRLGGRVLTTENAREFSSAAKGETIEDTVRVIGCYADAIAIRHHEEGAAQRAAAVSPVPIINAGDGKGQHPTQALLDLYTIVNHFGTADGLHLAFAGDLNHGRTVRSLAYLMGKFEDATITFAAPEQLQAGVDIVNYCRRHDVNVRFASSLEETLDADCLYMTRIQKERMTPEEHDDVKGKFILTASMAKCMKQNSIIMHPLPRVDEIEHAVDLDHRAKYFEQAKNGLYMRMALLKELLIPR